MKILVVGGAGYIGCVLVPKLQDRGYDVDVLDLLWFGNNLPAGTRLIQRSVLELTEQDLKGYSAVIFIAGLSNDPMAEFSPALNFIDNAASPAFLAYIAKRAGVKRFIHGGSCSVYGYAINQLYEETSPAICNYPYGISKLQGESGCMQLADDSFSVIGIRKGTVCGYSPRMRLDLVINTMFKSAIKDQVITVNNPAIWRPILSIQDAADGYIRALESAEPISGIFNIASGNYTLGELADYVKEGVLAGMGINARINVKHIQDLRNYKVSCSKANTILSFKARHEAQDIIKDLVENYQKFKDFDDPKYYNIQVFRALERSSVGTF